MYLVAIFLRDRSLGPRSAEENWGCYHAPRRIQLVCVLSEAVLSGMTNQSVPGPTDDAEPVPKGTIPIARPCYVRNCFR